MTAPGIGTGRYIGQSVRRKEDPRLLTGRGQFVDDIALPGMLHGAFARSPPVHPGTENNISAQMGDEEMDADLDALLKGAPHLITHKVVHQRISQSPMETRGVVATRDGTDELTLYITCQSPHLVARWT